MLEAKVHVSPEINPETEVFWTAANEKRLVLKRCLDTGKAFHPPRKHSPFTGLSKTEWINASGSGTIYSYSITGKDDAKECIAYIELDEGPIILSAIAGCKADEVAVGLAVEVDFIADAAGQNVPIFKLLQTT